MGNRISLSNLLLFATIFAFVFNAYGLRSQVSIYRQRISEVESELSRKEYSDISVARDPVASSLRMLNDSDATKYSDAMSILLRDWDKFVRKDSSVELPTTTGMDQSFVIRTFTYKEFANEESPAFLAMLINEENTVVDCVCVSFQNRIGGGYFKIHPRHPYYGLRESHPKLSTCSLSLNIAADGNAMDTTLGWNVFSEGFTEITANPAMHAESPVLSTFHK